MSGLSTKRGRYGCLKYKCFTYLSHYQYVSSRRLAIECGVSYYSVARHLKRWVDYGYVKRRICLTYGSGDYEYQIQDKARRWLRLAKAELPNAYLFQAEFLAWQKQLNEHGYRDMLLGAKFNDFTARLSWLVAGDAPVSS